MQGSIVKAAWVLGGCFVFAGLVLSATVWLAAHTAMGRVESRLDQLTRELATPIRQLFDRPVQVEVAAPVTVQGTWEDGVVGISTELPGRGP